MKTILAILAAPTLMVSAAQAGEGHPAMQAYFECWAGQAVRYVQTDDLDGNTVHNAMVWADSECSSAKQAAINENGARAAASARRFMQAQLIQLGRERAAE